LPEVDSYQGAHLVAMADSKRPADGDATGSSAKKGRIWSKGGDSANELVHAFTVGDDYKYDRVIARHDCLGCIAHATMLADTKIIPKEDGANLTRELKKLHQEYLEDKWTINAADEDVHSKIEALLTERIGAAGKRLHTGRSRNDQVLTAVRLWQKERLGDIAAGAAAAAQVMINKARELEKTPLPGYTHLQRGMPSSCGQFFAAHAQALIDNLILLEAAYQLADSCPLGSGASYGVPLPLDREQSASLLGFGRPGGISMADANSRGKAETASLDAAGAMMNDMSRFAADMVFFTTGECGFFRIGAGFTTGSSIMPQKKNLDLFELLRGRASRFLGLRTGLYATTLGLHSGYSRDLQDTKALMVDGLEMVVQGLAVIAQAVPSLEPQVEKIEASLTRDLYATDEAYRLVREEGWTFRDAYIHVGQNLERVPVPDHVACIGTRTHLGATGNLGLNELEGRLKNEQQRWCGRQDALHNTWAKLLD